jgi:hypothetical protein
VALAQAQLAYGRANPGSPGRSGQTSWPSGARSPVPSVASIPTRGWASPGGSVISEPPPRSGSPRTMYTGVTRPALCFLCYHDGHMIAECPRLPTSLQQEARENRDAWQKEHPAGGTRAPSFRGVGPPRPTPGSPCPMSQDIPVTPDKIVGVHAVQASVEQDGSHHSSNQSAGAGNDLGDQ